MSSTSRKWLGKKFNQCNGYVCVRSITAIMLYHVFLNTLKSKNQLKSRNACASEIVQSQILENEIYALLGKPKTDVIIHEWSTNVLRATMRENIPIWRRLRRKEKSRKLCTLGVHGMKMNAMRDQIKPCHLLHLQSSLKVKESFHFK